MKARPPALKATLAAAAARLRRARVAQPEKTAGELAAHVLGMRRLELFAHDRRALRGDERKKLDELCARACAHEPVAYLLGGIPFRGLDLHVDRRALIPRPESEYLVDRVLACADLWRKDRPRIADVGAGCGCIALALADAHPAARITGIDRSCEALALARLNARRTGLEAGIAWRENDLLAGWPANALDAVVANLPYVSSAACRRLPRSVRCYEPLEALDGGWRGLTLIARLVPQAAHSLTAGGWLFLETGAGQSRSILPILRRHGFPTPRVALDLGGRKRYIMAHKA